jgi:hypothetical protein
MVLETGVSLCQSTFRERNRLPPRGGKELVNIETITEEK